MAAALRVASLDAIEAALSAIGTAVRNLRINAEAAAAPNIFERDVERHNVLPPIAPMRAREAALQGMYPPVFVLYDFETTGMGKTSEIRIRQIGARAISSKTLESIGTFTTFVNPGVPTSEGAKKVCRIDAANEEYVAGLGTWREAGRRFSNWLQDMRNHNDDCPLHLIAHNGKRFDARILTFENARHYIDFNTFEVHSCDSIDVFKKVYPGLTSYSLGNIYQDVLGRELKGAHDAMVDVDGMWRLMKYKKDDAIANVISNSECFRHVQKRCFATKL